MSAAAMPQHLLDALDRGKLSDAELRELIALQAAELGLTFEEAEARYRAGALPRDYRGVDLGLLFGMLLDE